MIDVLAAIRAGRARFEWWPLEISERLTIEVFRDALMVDGVRVSVSAIVAQQAADLLDAMLTTPKTEDLIFVAATIHTEPHPGDVVHKTAEQHSAEIDAELVRMGKPTGAGELVATVGKSWCLASRLSAVKAANYGWHFLGSAFRGIRGEATVSLPLGTRVIQGVGTMHGPSHVDYSQTLRLVRRRCRVDGAPADLRHVLADPLLARLLSHEGALSVFRQPGVEELGSLADDTQPGVPRRMTPISFPAVADSSIPLRLRALAVCQAEDRRWGAAAPPVDRIDEYLAGCERAGARGLGNWLAQQNRDGAIQNFCAASVGWTERQAAANGEHVPPWRAAAKEIMADARAGKRGRWHSAAEIRAGYRPPPGALCIYHRGPPGAPTGHVDRYERAVDAEHYESRGANQAGRQWTLETRRFDNPNLLGVVVDDENAKVEALGVEVVAKDFVEPLLSDEDRAALGAVVAGSLIQTSAEFAEEAQAAKLAAFKGEP